MGIFYIFFGPEEYIHEFMSKTYFFIIFGIAGIAIAYVVRRRRKLYQREALSRKSKLTLRLDETEFHFVGRTPEKIRVRGIIAKVGPGIVRNFALGVRCTEDVPLEMRMKWNGDEDTIDHTHLFSKMRAATLTPGEERPVTITIFNPNSPAGLKFNIFFEIVQSEPASTYTPDDYIHIMCS
jgi:hypothetical protein